MLESLDLPHLSINLAKNEARFAKDEDSNPTSNWFSFANLKYYSFSSNNKGNIYSLVMYWKNLQFPEALKYVSKIIGMNDEDLNREIVLPFGGFYKKISRQQKEPELSVPTFGLNTLDAYKDKYNMQFLHSGISFETQEKYHIGIDFRSMRITVPEWTINGELCGIMGRALDKDCPHNERWFPIIPCQRSFTLFGYHQNYAKIQEKDQCVIFESEKAVMQLDSFGCYIGLATCGCHISPTQSKYIKSLQTKKIILAYDEGLNEKDVINEALKLKIDNPLLTNKVGYIWDEEGDIIPKGSKMNAADLGKEKFKQLLKEKVRWL